MFGFLIITLYLGEGIALSLQNLEFDKEYFGVVFEPYTKYENGSSELTLTEIENMLEIVAKRFRFLTTYDTGTKNASSKWIEGSPSGLSVAAASHINNKTKSLQLVVTIGTNYNSYGRIMRQVIDNAFSLADVANKNFLGSVNGIIITHLHTKTDTEVREVVELLKENAMRAQNSSLQLGVMSNNCEILSASLSDANSTFHDPALEMVGFLDFIVCHKVPHYGNGYSVSLELSTVTKYFLQVQREFAEVKPNLIVIGETAWPSFDRMNARFDPSQSVKFWLEMGYWARINKFRVDMYSAFDFPWDDEEDGRHLGWWKRLVNDTSDFLTFQEKIDDIDTKPTTNPNPPPKDQTLEFDKEYFGVVFTPYTKYINDRFAYTMTEVENMLEIVSKRFKWVSTLDMGTTSAKSKWNEGRPTGFSAAAASHINKRTQSLQLVVNIGTAYNSDDGIRRQEIDNAFAVADVANKNFLGSVNGIAISMYRTKTDSEVKERVKLLKENAMRAQNSSLQLGVMSENCKILSASLSDANSTFHDPTLEMLGFLDFIICQRNPSYDDVEVSSDVSTVTKYFLQVKREFLEVKPNLNVIGQTAWPSFDTKGRFDPSRSVKFWIEMEYWARINMFRVNMYSAFDEPWDLEGHKPHFGWWKRVKNDTMDFDAFQEKIDDIHTKPTRNPNPPTTEQTLEFDKEYFGVVFTPYTKYVNDKFAYTMTEVENMLEIVSKRFKWVSTLDMGTIGAKSKWNEGRPIGFSAAAASHINKRTQSLQLVVNVGTDYKSDDGIMRQEIDNAFAVADVANKNFLGTVNSIVITYYHTNSDIEVKEVVKLLKNNAMRARNSSLQLGVNSVNCDILSASLSDANSSFHDPVLEMLGFLDFIICHKSPQISESVSSEVSAVTKYFLQVKREFVEVKPNLNVIGQTAWFSFGRTKGRLDPSRSVKFWIEMEYWARINKFRVNMISAFDEPWQIEGYKPHFGWWKRVKNDTMDFDAFQEKIDDIDTKPTRNPNPPTTEQTLDFDKEYFGVVFSPYTKYGEINHQFAYTMREVENMLEIVSKRFKWVSTLGMGTTSAKSKWNEGWPTGFSAAVASNINKRTQSLQLVVNIGTAYNADGRIMQQEIANAFSVADVANKNFLGSVNGIIIARSHTKSGSEVRETVKLLKENAIRARNSSLQLGVKSDNCELLSASLSDANSTFHDPMLEMLGFLDFIICQRHAEFRDLKTVSSEISTVTKYFLQVKREFTEFKANLTVIGQTAWPSFDTINARFDPSQSVKLWLEMGEWAKINKFRVDMYTAFDEPWIIYEAGGPHYGWWKRIKDDTSDFDAFQEKLDYIEKAKEPTANLDTSLTDYTFEIVIGLVVLFIFGILGGFLFLYKMLIAVKNQRLTPAEIDAFENGLKSELGGDGNMEDAIKLPYDRSYEIHRSKLVIDTGNVLGRGAFGIVYKGKIEGRTDDVAFKMTLSNCTAMNLKSLLSEIKIMIHVGKHQNVVSIVGACTGGIKKGIIIIASEFCIGGNLRGRLREYKAELSQQTASIPYVNVEMYASFISPNLIEWPIMIIHADLATRNVLLSANGTAKITDFGLSRHLYEYTTYVKQNQEPLPWRWMAIESLKDLTFSTKSDVWSYAVTLSEIFSLGDIPFPGLSWTVDFANDLEKGLRMGKPNFATAEMYLTMCDCWNLEPAERPSFSSLASFFNSLLYETAFEIEQV